MMRSTALTNAVDDQAESAGHFSATNVQVEGVDEADQVKYDGHYIYLSTPIDYSGETPKTSIKIFSTDPANASATEISNTPLDASYWGELSELYLVGNESNTTGLASIRRSWNMIHFIEPMNEDRAAMSVFLPYHMDTGINIDLYDVQNPATPTKTWNINIDGDLLGSRKIDNMLYIVSSFVPSLATINYAPQTTAEKINNETLIAQARVEKLLPQYSINGGTPQPLSTSNSCLIPNNITDDQGYFSLVNITAINLTTQSLVESTCVDTSIQGIYVSTHNLYLGGSDNTTWGSGDPLTVVHKFSLTEQGIDYHATGAVEGYLGWSSPSFRMDEQGEHLRVVTTHYDETGAPIHQLHVLQDSGSNNHNLLEVARLPNDTHPEPIGKPREDIFAVRFYGDKAYVVTFERKDPLYVLNLANPEDPSIAGTLEIPGFSTYLHPVGDDYLFSLGNEVDDSGLITGIKAALFDIRDIRHPMLVNQHVFANSLNWSEALYDHRALSFLAPTSDQLRISFPVILFDQSDDPQTYEWNKTSLQLFEINGLSNQAASLDYVGEVIGDSNDGGEYYGWYGNDRSLLHDDSVFYVHNSNVIGSHWAH